MVDGMVLQFAVKCNVSQRYDCACQVKIFDIVLGEIFYERTTAFEDARLNGAPFKFRGSSECFS
jgi:hypothetical protein